jgi:hypothetical protein
MTQCYQRASVLRNASALLVALAWFGSAPATAATLTYPGAAPCNATLQACTDGAASGDIIEIATNTPNTEFVSVENKSLTIRPATGFTPQLAALFFVASTSNVVADVSGLSFTSSVSARIGGGGGNLNLSVRNNTINAGDSLAAMEVGDGSASGTYGVKTVTITNNTIVRGSSFSGCASGIRLGGTSANFTATVTGNTISLTDLDQCAGIEAVVGVGVNATALIDRNRITGSNFNGGIQIRNFGASEGQPGGLIQAQVSNNLIAGQNGNTGASGGIVVSADGNNAAANVIIVNNTVANGRSGILISGRPDLGAAVTGGIYNNIVAFHSRSGIGVETDFSGFANANNLVFSNTDNFFTAGPGTRVGNPSFVNAAALNYQLAPDSDAIDRGSDSSLPSTFTQDLPGNARRLGNSIDIGAYESTIARGADVVPTVPTVGVTALAGLLAALGLLGVVGLRWQRQA